MLVLWKKTSTIPNFTTFIGGINHQNMGATFLDIGSIRDVGQPKCIANKAQESPRSMAPDVYDL